MYILQENLKKIRGKMKRFLLSVAMLTAVSGAVFAQSNSENINEEPNFVYETYG